MISESNKLKDYVFFMLRKCFLTRSGATITSSRRYYIRETISFRRVQTKNNLYCSYKIKITKKRRTRTMTYYQKFA